MTEERKALLSDWDNTLFDTENILNAFLQHHYGVTFPANTHQCGSSFERLILGQIPTDRRPTLDEFYAHFNEEYMPSMEWHRDVQPVPGSVEAITELAGKFEIYILTARLVTSRMIVQKVTEQFFPRLVRNFHFVHTRTDKGEIEAVPKRDFICGIEPRLRAGFVDDSPLEVRRVQDIVPAYLFDPKGYHADVRDCTRITSWSELVDALV